MKFSFLLIFTYLISNSFASSIVGFAPGFIGQQVKLYTYADYLTMNKKIIGSATVSAKDSSFKIDIDIKQTIKAVIEIANSEAEIYLSPNNNYNIFYKLEKGTPKSFAKQKAVTYFKGLDKADINYKILEFSNWFDEFTYTYYEDIKLEGLEPYIDSFKILVYDKYSDESNEYFINYVRFWIANLELTKSGKKYKNSKFVDYKNNIEPFPIYPYNDQYMKYVKSMYGKSLSEFHTQIQAEIMLAIDASSHTKLMNVIKKDPLYEKKELRQLMIVKLLGNSYYTREYPRKNIQTILDSIANFSVYVENRVAAKNMLLNFTKIEIGYPVPEINIVDNHNENIKWSDYKGKFIYVNFFTTWNTEAMSDLKLMQELYIKYSYYIEFVSFCLDEDHNKFDQFLTENQSFTWPFVYLGTNHQISNGFNVRSTPSYFLIDQEGFIAMAPAKGPSPDGVYETIENTFKYIKKELDK